METEYYPFISPPDFNLAQKHYEATMMSDPSSQISWQCSCCKQSQTLKRPRIFIKAKDLLFLGPQIPYLFYFFEVMMILIIGSLFVVSGQFIMCGMVDNSECEILRLDISFLKYHISLPVGFNDQKIEYVYVIVIAAYMLIIFAIQYRINKRYVELAHRRLGYADLSVILQNVPKDSTKDEIKQFLCQLQFDHFKEITLVKKVRLFKKMLQYRRQLKKKLSRAIIDNNKEKIQDYNYEWASITTCIEKYKIDQTETQHRSNQVFVTFNRLLDKTRFLKLYRHGLLHRLFFKCCTSFSITKIRQNHIQIQNAPPPRDIIWQNLEKPFYRTRLRRIISNILCFVVVIFGASAAFGLKTFESTVIFGIVIGAFIQFTNFLIIEFLAYSISSQYYWTYTQTKVCQVNRLTFFLFLNITIVPFLLYLYGILSSKSQIQIWNEMAFSVLFISISNVAKPLILILQPRYFLQKFKRFRQKLKGTSSVLCQFQAHSLFQAPQFQIHEIYSLIISSFLSTFFFLSRMPILIASQILLIIGITITSRYLLTSRCKTPPRFTRRLSNCVNFLFKLCIPLFYLGHILFKYLENSNQSILQLLLLNVFQGIQLGLVIVYIFVIIIFDLPLCLSKKSVLEQQQNSQQQRSFITNSLNYDESNMTLRLLQGQQTNCLWSEKILSQDQTRELLQSQISGF